MPVTLSPRCANSSCSGSTKKKPRATSTGQGRPVAERRLIGKLASSGIVAGPIALLSSRNQRRRSGGDPGSEGAALRTAVATALGDLTRLAARAERDGADILDFQIAMLEDVALAAPAFAA